MTGEQTRDQPPHIPAVFNKLHGQPVEQLGVAREIALRAEVRAGFHQACTEDLLPHAIDRYTCGERVLAVNQPVGEIQPIVITILRLGRQGGKKLGTLRLTFSPG